MGMFIQNPNGSNKNAVKKTNKIGESTVVMVIQKRRAHDIHYPPKFKTYLSLLPPDKISYHFCWKWRYIPSLKLTAKSLYLKNRWVGRPSKMSFWDVRVAVRFRESKFELRGYGCFLKWWYPTTVGFPTKHDHFGVWNGDTTIQGNPYNYSEEGNQNIGHVKVKSWTPKSSSASSNEFSDFHPSAPNGPSYFTHLGACLLFLSWTFNIRFLKNKQNVSAPTQKTTHTLSFVEPK